MLEDVCSHHKEIGKGSGGGGKLGDVRRLVAKKIWYNTPVRVGC